jgi:uncharacterized phage protein (TIGR02216 family)
MEIGLGAMHLAPKDFWTMSLREFTSALGMSAPKLSRGDFEDLMKRYPD